MQHIIRQTDYATWMTAARAAVKTFLEEFFHYLPSQKLWVCDVKSITVEELEAWIGGAL